jgi:putative SOS response-associated peptidase YedK
MCYNYATNIEAKQLEKEFNKTMAEEDQQEYEKHYNVDGFRHLKMPVISNDNVEAIELCRWGLVPSWVKKQDKALQLRKATLNAKSETIFELTSFRQVAPYNRCLILATGFFEPHHNEDGSVTYYYIHFRNKAVFAFGGIWSTWVDEDTGEVEKTYSMLTTPPTQFMAEIHNNKPRMPLIIPDALYDTWLDKDLPKQEMVKIMQPYHDVELEAWPVSKLINNRKNFSDVPEVSLRVEAVNNQPLKLF